MFVGHLHRIRRGHKDILSGVFRFQNSQARSIGEKSLRKLSAIVLGQRVSKAQRLSNWEATTLTDKQQLYAATDAWVCTRIYEQLLRTPKKPIRK
jgi:ribonuclease D